MKAEMEIVKVSVDVIATSTPECPTEGGER